MRKVAELLGVSLSTVQRVSKLKTQNVFQLRCTRLCVKYAQNTPSRQKRTVLNLIGKEDENV